MENTDKRNILETLENGNFDVEIEAPEGIEECTNYKGETFLRLMGEGPQMGVYAGKCLVYVEDYTLECDLNDGFWTIDQEALDDEEIIDVLESAEGVYHGEHTDGFSLSDLYAEQNNLEYSTFCWGYDLKDVDDLGEGEAEIPIKYRFDGEEDWEESEFTINDGHLLKLYQYLKEKDSLPVDNNEIEISDSEIKDVVPELYDDLYDQILEESKEDGTNLEFQVTLSDDVIEMGLFGEPYN